MQDKFGILYTNEASTFVLWYDTLQEAESLAKEWAVDDRLFHVVIVDKYRNTVKVIK